MSAKADIRPNPAATVSTSANPAVGMMGGIGREWPGYLPVTRNHLEGQLTYPGNSHCRPIAAL
jgi:hypothetical protein